VSPRLVRAQICYSLSSSPSSQRDDDIIDSVLVLVRQYGLLDAKDIIRSNAAVLNDAFRTVIVQREAAAAEAAAEAAAAAAAEEEERLALGAMSNGRHH
jgi:hypothetical protein